MQIDAATRRNLELTETLSGERRGSLLAVIDRTLDRAGGASAGRAFRGPADRAGAHRGATRRGAVPGRSPGGPRGAARVAAAGSRYRAGAEPARPRTRRPARSGRAARRARRDGRAARRAARPSARPVWCRCRICWQRPSAASASTACLSSGSAARWRPTCRCSPATAGLSRRAICPNSTSCASCATTAGARSPRCRRAMPRRAGSPRCASGTTM